MPMTETLLAEAMQYAKGPLPLRELMAQLNALQRERAWAEIENALRQFGGPDGYDSSCELLIGIGTKRARRLQCSPRAITQPHPQTRDLCVPRRPGGSRCL